MPSSLQQAVSTMGSYAGLAEMRIAAMNARRISRIRPVLMWHAIDMTASFAIVVSSHAKLGENMLASHAVVTPVLKQQAVGMMASCTVVASSKTFAKLQPFG